MIFQIQLPKPPPECTEQARTIASRLALMYIIGNCPGLSCGWTTGYLLLTNCTKRCSPSVRVFLGQAMFHRMNPSPSGPYMVPALSHR